MRPQRPDRGFGYAIDYNREIAMDLRTIADTEHLIAQRLLKPDSWPTGYAFSVADAAIEGGEWLERLGITEDERHAIAWERECSDDAMLTRGIPLTQPTGNWYARADAALKRIADLVRGWGNDLPTLAEMKRLRSKAKADLARHRRNQRKYDPSSAKGAP